jgi:hypothetical protein
MAGLWTPSAGTKGLDRSDTIANAAQALFDQGFRFAIRTVGLPGGSPGTIKSDEVTAVHSAGIALGISQVIRHAGFSDAQGTQDGTVAASEASALGFPSGGLIWFDLEGERGVASQSLITFLNNWAAAVVDAGYLAGLYNGPQSVLTGHDISALPQFHAYWQAAALVPQVARGYQIYQLLPSNTFVAGINIDIDVVQTDFDGSSPSFWLG